MLYMPEFFETTESINIFEILVFQFTIPHHTVHNYSIFLPSKREPGSSGSIVSDYGLDVRAIGVRSPAGAKDFSSILCVQTVFGAHPASCPTVTGGPFPGGKARLGRDANHSPPI
jgi:hypothetical protein